jgi:ADP-ribose pyrophosphatase
MEETLFHGLRFNLVKLTQTTDRGTRQREVIRHPGSVVILPMIDDETVCLIRNFRVAVDEALIELPAGTLEPNESAETTAHRELIEETGYRAANLKPLHSFFAAPGCLDERMSLFLGTGLEPGNPQREIGEQIENLVVSWDDAVCMACDGTIHDAKTIVGILLYDRLRRQL